MEHCVKQRVIFVSCLVTHLVNDLFIYHYYSYPYGFISLLHRIRDICVFTLMLLSDGSLQHDARDVWTEVGAPPSVSLLGRWWFLPKSRLQFCVSKRTLWNDVLCHLVEWKVLQLYSSVPSGENMYSLLICPSLFVPCIIFMIMNVLLVCCVFSGYHSIRSLSQTEVQLISFNKWLTLGFCSFSCTNRDGSEVGDLNGFSG